MKTIILSLASILFVACATPKMPVPPPRTDAQMAAWMKRVAESEQKISNADYSFNMQFFDE